MRIDALLGVDASDSVDPATVEDLGIDHWPLAGLAPSHPLWGSTRQEPSMQEIPQAAARLNGAAGPGKPDDFMAIDPERGDVGRVYPNRSGFNTDRWLWFMTARFRSGNQHCAGGPPAYCWAVGCSGGSATQEFPGKNRSVVEACGTSDCPHC
jgi:hypothetical protein